MAKDHAKRSEDGIAHPYGVELVGPFDPDYIALVKGKRLPYLALHPVTNDPGRQP